MAIPPLHVSFVGFVSFCLFSILELLQTRVAGVRGLFSPTMLKNKRANSHTYIHPLMSQMIKNLRIMSLYSEDLGLAITDLKESCGNCMVVQSRKKSIM